MQVRTNIRRAWRTTILGGVLAALAISMPTTASALPSVPCYQTANPAECMNPNPMVHPWAGFQGWGQVTNLYCPANSACPAIGVPATVAAWRWNGSWSAASLRNDEQVYVYPYAVGWSWVWTQRTGWLAVSDQYVYVSKYGNYYL